MRCTEKWCITWWDVERIRKTGAILCTAYSTQYEWIILYAVRNAERSEHGSGLHTRSHHVWTVSCVAQLINSHLMNNSSSYIRILLIEIQYKSVLPSRGDIHYTLLCVAHCSSCKICSCVCIRAILCVRDEHIYIYIHATSET